MPARRACGRLSSTSTTIGTLSPRKRNSLPQLTNGCRCLDALRSEGPRPADYLFCTGCVQPRLAAALKEFSEILDSETDPEDPTYFGTPTETGVDNYFEPDGSPSDVWSRYEI